MCVTIPDGVLGYLVFTSIQAYTVCWVFARGPSSDRRVNDSRFPPNNERKALVTQTYEQSCPRSNAQNAVNERMLEYLINS